MGFKQGSGRSNEKWMLFSLDMKDFAVGIGKLMKFEVMSTGIIEGGMAFFNTEDGSGYFNEITARCAAVYIKNCITDPQKYGIPTGTWGRSEEWLKILKRYGALDGTQPYYFTGALRNSVGVIYRGKHSQTVGIKRTGPNSKVKQNPFSAKSKMIPVAKYAKWLEWGTSNLDARMLFTNAIKNFIHREFPSAEILFDKALKTMVADGNYLTGKSDKEEEARMGFEALESAAGVRRKKAPKGMSIADLSKDKKPNKLSMKDDAFAKHCGYLSYKAMYDFTLKAMKGDVSKTKEVLDIQRTGAEEENYERKKY